jgi:hypothetical protein
MKTLNEQINRINQLFNYEVGVTITEQTTPVDSSKTNPTKIVTQVERFSTPESKKINYIFMNEFLPSLTPTRDEMVITKYIDTLKSISDTQLKPVIEFFTKKGYKQPNEDIKKFQQDLLRVTGIDKYANKEQINNEFKDGVFGVATARAVIGSYLENLNNVAKKNPNILMGDMSKQSKVDLSDKTATQKTAMAPQKVAGKSVEIGVGTQKIK